MDPAMYMSVQKGLQNLEGENNCFLNVVIQALWHMKSFRIRFQQAVSHEHRASITPAACPHCALSAIFSAYKFSEGNTIPPVDLRRALDTLYKSEQRFQLGAFDDAAEALDAILTCVEKVSVDPSVSIPRKVFGIDMVEYTKCAACKAVSQPVPCSHYIYYSYVDQLMNLHYHHPKATFEALLRTVAHQEIKSCPNEEKCSEKVRVLKHLERHPDVFSIGLVWSTENPSPEEIVRLLRTISPELDLSRIFSPHRTRSRHRFRGMICYYGKHYDAYFYSDTRRQWLVFDDATVKEVGMDWASVIDRCRRGRFHPSVLFYERDFSFKPPPQAAKAQTAAQQTAAQPSPVHTTSAQPSGVGSVPSRASAGATRTGPSTTSSDPTGGSHASARAAAPTASAPPTTVAERPGSQQAQPQESASLVDGYVVVPQATPSPHPENFVLFNNRYCLVPQRFGPPPS